MLKRMVLALCLLLLPCLLLAACGGDGAATSESATEAKTDAATEERTSAETDAATEPITAAATDPATEPVTERETEPATTDDGIYTVTFSIDGNETSFEVPRGELPVCPEEFLSWETATNYCKVTGWDKEIVPAEADVTYTATVGRYGLTVYNVRFNLKSGIINVPTHEGETPTPPAGYETDLSKVDKIGTFVRWSPELVAPTAENMEGKKVVVYTPVYTYSTRYYDVTFVVKGTDYPVKVAGNTVPVCPVDPAEAEEGVNRYLGWNKPIGAATEDAVYTAVYGNAAQASVLAAKDGAKSILTMTYDRDTAVWVNEKNKQYGLAGSEMLIAGRSSVTDRVSYWKSIFADGTLEPQSLSMTHSSDRITSTPAINKIEVVDSKAKIESLFPGSAVICYGSPFAKLSDYSYEEGADGTPDKSTRIEDGGTKALARATYFAIRNGKEGLNTLDPGCTDEAGGWYNLMVQWFYKYDSQTDEIRAAWIDNAVKKGGWLVILAHDFVDGTEDDYLSLSKDKAEAFFRHASTYVKSGELWAASFGDATKYLREKQNATAARHTENGIFYVDLKLDPTTEDGKTLDPNVFNYPLTVKVRVPASWTGVRYELDGETIETEVFADAGGQKCAMVNVRPCAGAVVSVPLFNAN